VGNIAVEERRWSNVCLFVVGIDISNAKVIYVIAAGLIFLLVVGLTIRGKGVSPIDNIGTIIPFARHGIYTLFYWHFEYFWSANHLIDCLSLYMVYIHFPCCITH
jgi:hypothetical protein